MNVQDLANKFKKEAQAGLNTSLLLKQLNKMKRTLAWFRNKSDMHELSFMKGAKPNSIFSLRQSADQMMQALDKLIPDLDRLDDVLDGDYMQLDEEDKRFIAQTYNRLIKNMDDWHSVFRKRYRKPWLSIARELNQAAQDGSGSREYWRADNYFDNNIMNYLNGVRSHLKRHPYLGRSGY